MSVRVNRRETGSGRSVKLVKYLNVNGRSWIFAANSKFTMKKISFFSVALVAVAFAFAGMGCSSQSSNEQAAQDLVNSLSSSLSTESSEAVEAPMACSEDQKMATFEKAGVKLCYPGNWTSQADPEMEYILMSELEGANDIFQENANVVTEDLPYSMSASEYMDASMSAMNSMLSNFSKVDRGSQNINGRTAEWMLYNHEMGEYKIRVKVWSLTKGAKAYVITCSSLQSDFDKFAKTFDSIAASARVL